MAAVLLLAAPGCLRYRTYRIETGAPEVVLRRVGAGRSGLKRIVRCIWLVTLCAALPGCTTYRPAFVTEVGAPDEYYSILEGDTVRLVLSSGEKVSGKVLWLTSEKLALGRPGSQGEADRVVDVASIAHAEIRNQSDGQIEGQWFMTLGAAALVGVYVMFRSIK